MISPSKIDLSTLEKGHSYLVTYHDAGHWGYDTEKEDLEFPAPRAVVGFLRDKKKDHIDIGLVYAQNKKDPVKGAIIPVCALVSVSELKQKNEE